MSKIFQLEGGQYEHPNEYKLVSTVRGTTILQPEFGTVIIEGDVIEASTHNTIQKNGVLASKVNVTMESTDTVLVPTDMTIESDLFNELKIMLLFETGTTLPSNSFIKLKDTNIPIANVNDYVVNANTPLLFLYFDSKFYAYKAGEGASTGAESLGDLSDVTLTSPTSGQALVYNGTKFVNQTVSGGGGGASKLDDLSDVVITAPTTNQTLVYNGTNFINKTVEEPKILYEYGSITGVDGAGNVRPWMYHIAKQGKLCTATFYLEPGSGIEDTQGIENIQGMFLNFGAMQNTTAFLPSAQYDIYPYYQYYKCQANHIYAYNVVTITLSSQGLTFNDKARGIDRIAFFTITYFTD